MNWLEEMIFKWRWLDNKVTQGRLWYFRAFKMRSMPRRPEHPLDQMIAEQELLRTQEHRRHEEQKIREAQEALRKEWEQREGGIREEEEDSTEDVIPKDWLRDKLSLEQAEADNTPAGGGVPFNKQNDRWERLKASLQAGDQVWAFSSSHKSWENLAGRAGVAVVRNGRVVDCIVTIMN
jgi:hypothetical protein